ncbi:MAG TPA: polymer-forming cytoskeletal protein, partial [Acidobacteriota bacterium]|nr:polymer-forming cytoskeletal protein [Acidobacteriota bacterium]
PLLDDIRRYRLRRGASHLPAPRSAAGATVLAPECTCYFDADPQLLFDSFDPRMRYARALLYFLPLLVADPDLFAEEPPEIRRFLHQIVVQRGQNVGNVQCSGCSVLVQGSASGDVVAIGGDITIEGAVGGDAIALGGDVHLLSPARLKGDAMALGGYVRADEGARASGDSESIPYMHVPGQRSLHLTGIGAFLAASLSLLLLAAVGFRRRRAMNLSGAVAKRPGMVFVSGTLSAFLVMLLFILTGIARQSELLWVLLVTAGVVYAGLAGYLGVCGALGRLLARQDPWLLPPLAGAVALTALMLVPVAGFIVFMAAFVMVLGGAIASGFGTSTDWLAERLKRRRP